MSTFSHYLGFCVDIMGTYCAHRSFTLYVLHLPQQGWDTDPCLSVIKRLNETCDVWYSQFRSCSLLSPITFGLIRSRVTLLAKQTLAACHVIVNAWRHLKHQCSKCDQDLVDFREFLDHCTIWYSVCSPTRQLCAKTCGSNSKSHQPCSRLHVFWYYLFLPVSF